MSSAFNVVELVFVVDEEAEEEALFTLNSMVFPEERQCFFSLSVDQLPQKGVTLQIYKTILTIYHYPDPNIFQQHLTYNSCS